MDEESIVLQAVGLHKSFRVPVHRIDTLKERALHPFAPVEYSDMPVLRNVSFDVARGEWLGIAGRNGSGKTTLLKLLASVYRADAGTIRVAGRMAPFIELGVGFNLNLAARENVILNGVMLGLTPREARARFDEVVAFAELEDFTDLKLKNYSSGMLVRLGFSMMMHVEADILLLDEVLAVGDAAFQQKCADAFGQLRREGKTVLLVSHDMGSLRRYCDKAILLDSGNLLVSGDPDEVGRRYLGLNFPADADDAPATPFPASSLGKAARIVDTWLEDTKGMRTRSILQGKPITFRALVEVDEEIEEPRFGLELWAEGGTRIFAPPPERLADHVRPGERLRVSIRLDNPLARGHYSLACSLTRGGADAEIVDLAPAAANLIVYGPPGFAGIVDLRQELQIEPEPSARER